MGKTFLHSQWLPVRVGANTDGVYVISTEKEVSIVISIEIVTIFIEKNYWLIKRSIIYTSIAALLLNRFFVIERDLSI